MSALLSILNVSFSRGSNSLLEQISLNIVTGDRIGLVGHNGSGKSTLLSLITGSDEPDDGEIRIPRGQRIALVEQFLPEDLRQQPLTQAVLSALPTEQHQDN